MSRVVLVTGASGGLGSAVTVAFAEAGYAVAAVARGIRPSAHYRAFASDLADPESLVREVEAELGPVHGLVHLVGGFTPGAVAETSDDGLRGALELNLVTAWRTFRAVLPGMRARRAGVILGVGSKAVLANSGGAAAYVASKAALVSVIQSLAAENPELSANAVLPGTMDTPANRQAMPDADPSRWVPVEQVAATLVHLVRTPSISGAAIPLG